MGESGYLYFQRMSALCRQSNEELVRVAGMMDDGETDQTRLELVQILRDLLVRNRDLMECIKAIE